MVSVERIPLTREIAWHWKLSKQSRFRIERGQMQGQNLQPTANKPVIYVPKQQQTPFTNQSTKTLKSA